MFRNCMRTLSCYLLIVTPLIGITAREARAANVPLPPILQIVQDNQQAIYETLFPRGTYNPDVFPYGLDNVVSGTGDYTGNAPDGPFTLTVNDAYPFDPNSTNGILTPEQLQMIQAESARFVLVYGSLSTTDATVDVAGIAISVIDPATNITYSRFLLMDYLSNIMPPPTLTRNGGPGSCSEDPAAYTPPPADSTVICNAPTCEDDPNEGKRLNPQCQQNAENQWRQDMANACRNYNDAMDAAHDAYLKAIAIATAGYVAALAGCAVLGFLPFVGAGIATKCAIAASAAYVGAIAAANYVYEADKAEAAEQYNTDVSRANIDLNFNLAQCCEDCPKKPKKAELPR